MYTITTERPEDGPAIEALLDTAFGPFRDSKVSYRYRAGVAPVENLRLVARDADDALIGTIRYWPILIGHAAKPGLLLGPLAVASHWQAKGVGAALMHRSLDMACWARHERILLVGDYGYYRRFGFRPASPHGIVMPGENPARLLALPLAAGAFDGAAGPIQPWRWVRGRGGKLAGRSSQRADCTPMGALKPFSRREKEGPARVSAREDEGHRLRSTNVRQHSRRG